MQTVGTVILWFGVQFVHRLINGLSTPYVDKAARSLKRIVFLLSSCAKNQPRRCQQSSAGAILCWKCHLYSGCLRPLFCAKPPLRQARQRERP